MIRSRTMKRGDPKSPIKPLKNTKEPRLIITPSVMRPLISQINKPLPKNKIIKGANSKAITKTISPFFILTIQDEIEVSRNQPGNIDRMKLR